jgi:GNAT superfamily N-acetyltransferase
VNGIRVAESADLSGLLALYRHLHAVDAPLPEATEVERLWATMMAHPGLRLIVAESAGLLVSCCTLVIVPNLTRGCRPYALVENVVTHADFRRRGFGGAVVKKAMDLAWDAGCYKVMLMTGSKRPETHRFYEHCGFLPEKTGFVARPSAVGSVTSLATS